MGIDVDNFDPEVITRSRDMKVSKDKLLKHELNELFEGCELEVEKIAPKIVLANLKSQNTCQVRVKKYYIQKVSNSLIKLGFKTQVTGRFCNKLQITWSTENIDVINFIKLHEYKLGLSKKDLESLYEYVKYAVKDAAKSHKREGSVWFHIYKIGHITPKMKFIRYQLINRFYDDGLVVGLTIREWSWQYRFHVTW